MQPGNGEDRSPAGGYVVAATLVDALAFLCELALLAVLIVAGWDLGSGGLMSVALAVFYPALAVLIWSLWMAPTSSRRLADPWRLAGQLLLFGAAAALVAYAGHVVLGITVGAIGCLVFAATRVLRPPQAPSSEPPPG